MSVLIPLVPPVFRPPSEADALIVQATLGCSWNHCTYCAMYRTKRFAVRPIADVVAELRRAGDLYGPSVRKVFVADGDALAMPTAHWLALLDACRDAFPRLRRVSCYATAMNVLEKSPGELRELADAGLRLLYLGPESGDETTLRRIAKAPARPLGRPSIVAAHLEAAEMAHAAGMRLSVIFLLGAGGTERSEEHARASARLLTAMDPAYAAALTLTLVEGTPLWKRARRGLFELPDTFGLLRELRTLVAEAEPTDCLFRTNHASNYLALGGRLPRDRDRIAATIDAALAGSIPLRPEYLRGL